jgi:hypothetical protein
MPQRPTPQDVAKARPPGGKRVGAAEVIRRGRAIEEMMALGHSRERILSACERRFKMSPRTTDEYIQRVKDAWAEEASRTRPERREAARARLLRAREDLTRWRQGGPLVALERLLCDIDGTKEPDAVRIEAEVKATPPEVAMSQEAIAEEMAALVACIPSCLRAGTLAPSDELRRVVIQLGRELGLRMVPGSNEAALGAP